MGLNNTKAPRVMERGVMVGVRIGARNNKRKEKRMHYIHGGGGSFAGFGLISALLDLFTGSSGGGHGHW